MDPSDSQTQSGEGSRETSEVFDSLFGFLMDFADRAETTVPQPKRRTGVDDATTNEVRHEEEEEAEEPSEDGGDGNAREPFDKLTVRGKEGLLVRAFSKMLDKLPEDGKEPFLARCYDGLFPKLPRKWWRMLAIYIEEEEEEEEEEEPSEDGGDGNARELFDKLTAREKESLLVRAFSKMLDKLPEDGKEPFLARCYDGLFPKLPREWWRMNAIQIDYCSRVVFCSRKVKRPRTVGNPQPPPGTGAQQPPPGQQQPPPGTGAQQPPPGTSSARSARSRRTRWTSSLRTGMNRFWRGVTTGCSRSFPASRGGSIATKVEYRGPFKKSRKVKFPETVGNPQPPPGTGAQQPPPGTGAQQPPPGPQQPPPGPTA